MSFLGSRSCVVPSCSIEQRKEVNATYHRFPNRRIHLRMKQKWIDIIRELKNDNSWEPAHTTTTICSRHFHPSQIIILSTKDESYCLKTTLKPTALPTETLHAEIVVDNILDTKVEVEDNDKSESHNFKSLIEIPSDASIKDSQNGIHPVEDNSNSPVDLPSCENCSDILRRLFGNGGVVRFEGRVFNISSEEVIDSDSVETKPSSAKTDSDPIHSNHSGLPENCSYSTEDYEEEDVVPFGKFSF